MDEEDLVPLAQANPNLTIRTEKIRAMHPFLTWSVRKWQ